MPLALAHGACLIALTIDEVGMAKTAERKLEIAQRLKELCCDEHGLDPEALIFDCLTFTLTTGEEEWRPSAVETIEGIRRVKEHIPGVKTSLGVSNVSFGVAPRARAVLNSVFLHHCVAAGPGPRDGQPEPHHALRRDQRGRSASSPTTSCSTPARTRWSSSSRTSSPRARCAEEEKADPTEGMEPEEALHFHILRRKKEGVEDWIDQCVEKIGAVPTLNDVLLPAMKEVGDKFGAGELILPFVLQSATVMKRAVAQLEKYLDKVAGYTKGTVVLATVFGDVHDIGKSLVNTILTNNGYTVVDLGKQVPISTILEAAQEHDATAIGLSALLVSTSKQMPLAIEELHAKGLDFPVLIGGAAINRDFGLRALYPFKRESDEIYEPGVFYCKDAFEGLNKMDQLIEPEGREALLTKTREAAANFRLHGKEPEALITDDDTVRSAARTDVRDPRAAVLGRARDRRPARRRLPPPRHARAVQAALGRARREGRGVAQARRRGLPAAPGAHVARAGLPAPARAARLLPLLQRGQRGRRPRPRGPRDGARAPRLPAPARARPHLPGRLLPPEGRAASSTSSRCRR